MIKTFNFERQAATFKALAHPVRLQILVILRQGEACVCHLEMLLEKRQAYISQQIAVLKGAGMLSERREGNYVFYSLADPSLEILLDESRLFTNGNSRLMQVIPILSPIDQCPCPSCAASF
jgi:DNA-binding transcriptional ArsR family regulator